MIVEIKNGYCSEAQFILNDITPTEHSLAVWDSHSKQFWYCSDESLLSTKFLFTGDLSLFEVADRSALLSAYEYCCKDVSPVRKFSHTVYMLYSEELKVFDPYSMKSYPIIKYGKPIPRGLTSAKYKDRFERDQVIESFIAQDFCCIFNDEIHSEITGDE